MPKGALALAAKAATQTNADPDEALDAILAAFQEVVDCQTVLTTHIDSTDIHILKVLNTQPDALDVPEGLTIPRTASPCMHIAEDVAPYNSLDMHADPHLADLPAAKDMGATTYFGVPVLLPDGTFFGSFAALDTGKKDHSEDTTQAMQVLARLAGEQLARQRDAQSA
jgi:hypothetical protein